SKPDGERFTGPVSGVEQEHAAYAVGVPIGEDRGDRSAHGDAGGINHGYLEGVEQVHDLAVVQIGIVGRRGPIRINATEQLVAQYADAGGGQAVEGRIPDVVGSRKAGDQQERDAGFGAAELVVSDTVAQTHETAGLCATDLVVDKEGLVAGPGILQDG